MAYVNIMIKSYSAIITTGSCRMPYSEIITPRGLVLGDFDPLDIRQASYLEKTLGRGPDRGFQKIKYFTPTPSATKNISVCDGYFLGLDNKWVGIVKW